MSIERVKAFFKERGLLERVLEFDVSSATVELAARAVNCQPAHIVKTLSFKDQAGDGCVLVACAGDARIDNKKFKEQFSVKASMLKPEDAIALTGHAVGGVCPFAVNPGVPIYIDRSIQRFETVYPAAGSANSAVKLTPDELVQLSGGTWIDVCKDWTP